MTMYTFHQAGVIPGLPGTFSNCRVQVGVDGQVDVLPLVVPHSQAPADVAEEPLVVSTATVVPEQATDEPVIALHLQ